MGGIEETLADIARAQQRLGKSRQRKLVNLDVAETSGVDRPAHLHEGWVVMKAAGQQQPAECTPASHQAANGNVQWLNPAEEASAAAVQGDGPGNVADMKPGDRQPLHGAENRAMLGRADCGHLYLLSPETVSPDPEIQKQLYRP